VSVTLRSSRVITVIFDPSVACAMFTGACTMTEVGSRNIGVSPYEFYEGSNESVTPAAHWTWQLPSAGGGNAVPGDYLFRDNAGFGTTSGIWGILRVQ
jgi:hypothetical protein